MNLTLHILRKDARRLWPAIVITLSLLAMLAINDRWRGDSVIGTTEGWLNLLMPLAWACLLAFAVLEEPLAGDRHLWLTRPHRWQILLSAKLLFALVFVHLPSFLAALYIVTARGFSLAESLPHLLAGQVTLAAAITLPAIALAALVGTFTQFMTLLFAVAAAAIFVTSGGPFRAMPDIQRPVDYLRPEFVAAVAGLSAIGICLLQYRRRKPAVARTVALLTVIMAGGLSAYVPPSFDYRVRAALHPAPALVLRQSALKPLTPPNFAPYNRDTVALPVALMGLPAEALYTLGPVDLTITTSDGSRYHTSATTPYVPANGGVPVFARIARFPSDLESAPLALYQSFERRLYDRLKTQRVRISGRMPVSFFRLGETAWMPIPGRVAAAGVGHCSTTVIEDHWSANSVVKVLCESPSHLPQSTRVTVYAPGVLRTWAQRLGNSASLTEGPQWGWLSPLDRAKSFVPISDPRTRQYQYSLDVPLEYIDKARIGITAEIPTGYTIVDFDFRDVALNDFYIKQNARR
jgi:hypothetical protein